MARVPSKLVPGGPSFKVVAASDVEETENAKIMTAAERITALNVAARDAITHVTAYSPIYFAVDARHGVTAYSWIFPKNLRYLNGTTPVATIANAASELTDPLGKLSTLATDYCVLTADAGDWTLYLDPADNTVKTVKSTALAPPANCIVLATVRGVQGTIQARSGVPAYILGRELFDAPRLFYHGWVFWDAQTKTIYLPRMTAQWPSSAVIKSNTPPSGYHSKSLSATASRKLFFDLAVADGADPLVVADNNDGAPRSTSLVEIGHSVGWNFMFAGDKPALVQLTNQRDKRVKNIAPYKPIYFVRDGEFGVSGGDYLMVPKLFRYVIEEADNTITNVDSIVNSLSTFVDPTGTYNWAADYVAMALPQNAENYCYIDVAFNALKTNSRASRPRSSGAAGIIPIGMVHRVGNTITSGAVPIYRASTGTELALAGRIGNVEATLDGLTGGSSSIVRNVTDGTSLRAYRTRYTRLQYGYAETLNVWLMGDSWHDRKWVAERLVALYTALGLSTVASGWVTPFNSGTNHANGPTGEVFTLGTGWTLYDNSSGAAPAADVSADGYIIRTSGGTQGTPCTYANLKGKELNIEYRNAVDGAKFRYRIVETAADGLSDLSVPVDWTTITSTGDGTFSRVQHTGLPYGAGRLRLEIDQVTANTSMAEITGVWLTALATKGATIWKCANAGSTSADLYARRAAVERVLAYSDVGAEVAVISCMVNDQRNINVSPDAFAGNMLAFCQSIRAGNSDCGIVYPAAPRNEDEDANSMRLYGDKLPLLAAEVSMLEYSRADLFWGTFAEEGGRTGMNTDVWDNSGNHLNGPGYRRAVCDYFRVQLDLGPMA